MSAVILGVYADEQTAQSVLSRLFEDGFPTDRINVIAITNPGHAALVPAGSAHEQFLLYFHTLFDQDDERSLAEKFAGYIEHGAATVVVHPRGAIETARASDILHSEKPVEVAHHDLAKQAFEHAASRQASMDPLSVATKHRRGTLYLLPDLRETPLTPAYAEGSAGTAVHQGIPAVVPMAPLWPIPRSVNRSPLPIVHIPHGPFGFRGALLRQGAKSRSQGTAFDAV
jgi:hypothetical protein